MILSLDGATTGGPAGDAGALLFPLGQYHRRAQFIVFDDQKSVLTDLVTPAAFFKSRATVRWSSRPNARSSYGEAGIDRSKVFVTNAVKHFKFELRGKGRLHKKPNAYEIERCRWWNELEREIVRPALVVARGATAARSYWGER